MADTDFLAGGYDPFNSYSNPGVYPGPTLFGYGNTPSRSPLENALQMLIPLLAEGPRQQLGLYGFTFNGQRSALDSGWAREYTRGLQAAREAGAQWDVHKTGQALEGLARLAGVPITPQYQQSIREFLQPASKVLPVLAAAFPEALNQGLGSTGSGGVGAEGLYQASRYLPTRGGRVGDLSAAERVTGFTQATFEELYGRGTPESPTSTRRTSGLSARDVGSAFNELTRRGVIGLDAEAAGPAGALAGGLSGRHAGTDVRSLGRQAAKQLEAYAGSLAVVKDIFGDLGDPDAPMSKVIQGLQTITRGGLGRLSPEELHREVSEFRAAARRSPLSYRELANYGQLGAEFAAAYGNHPLSARHAPLQAALGGKAYDELYRGLAGYEGLDKGEYIQERLRLQAAGQASPFGNMLGAVLAAGRLAGADTPLGRLAEHVRRGEHVATINGQTYDLTTATPQQLEALARQSKLGAGQFLEQLEHRRVNQAALEANPESRRVRDRAQEVELGQYLQNALAGDTRNVRDPARAARVLQEIISAGTYKGRRITSIADAAQAAAQELGDGADPRRVAALAQAVERAGGALTGGQDATAFYNRQRVVGAAARRSAEGLGRQLADEARDVRALTGEERGGFLAKFFDQLQRAGTGQPGAAPKDTLDFITRLLGGVSNDRVQALTGKPAGALPGGGPVPVRVEGGKLDVDVNFHNPPPGVPLRASGTANIRPPAAIPPSR